MKKFVNINRYIIVPNKLLAENKMQTILNLVKDAYEKKYFSSEGYVHEIKEICNTNEGFIINEGVRYKINFNVELYYYEVGEIIDVIIYKVTNLGIFTQDPNMPDIGQIFIPKEGVKTEVDGRLRVKIDGVRITDNKLIAVASISL
jgi:DNA-directed RNA polymerase subunit E'/Rpb7